MIRSSYGACARRAEDYETEESSKYVVSYEEMKAKAEEELVSPLGLFWPVFVLKKRDKVTQALQCSQGWLYRLKCKG